MFEVFELLTTTYGFKFDLGIFHPTCTYHTVSAAWAFNDPDLERYPGVGYHQKVGPDTLVGAARHEARDKAEADVKRIWALPIKRKAVENPIGTLSKRWRKPTQIIQPNWFGDNCKGHSTYGLSHRGCPHCGADAASLKPRWANQTDTGQNNLGPSKDRWKERSKTYPGPADAMAAQWGALLTV